MGSADVEAVLINTVILEIDWKRVDAYIRRGICYEKRGHLEKAEQDFRRAIDLDPDSTIAHSRLREVMESKAQIEAIRATQRSKEARARTAPDPPPTSHLRQSYSYDDAGWREETPLHRLGYRITKRTRHQRWQVLVNRAVPQLGLPEVAYTIAQNCRVRKLQQDGEEKYAHAIGEWEYDLARLRKEFYDGSFFWPSTDID
jgi:hypothetical protein